MRKISFSKAKKTGQAFVKFKGRTYGMPLKDLGGGDGSYLPSVDGHYDGEELTIENGKAAWTHNGKTYDSDWNITGFQPYNANCIKIADITDASNFSMIGCLSYDYYLPGGTTVSMGMADFELSTDAHDNPAIKFFNSRGLQAVWLPLCFTLQVIDSKLYVSSYLGDDGEIDVRLHLCATLSGATPVPNGNLVCDTSSEGMTKVKTMTDMPLYATIEPEGTAYIDITGYHLISTQTMSIGVDVTTANDTYLQVYPGEGLHIIGTNHRRMSLSRIKMKVDDDDTLHSIIYAGDPTEPPNFEGQIVYNASSKKIYMAVGTSSVDDWVQIGG